MICNTVVDARVRRRRRQLSSASYYISDVNPYSSSYSPTAPLTYPSGSFYNAPSYGYPGVGISADQPVYSADQSNIGMNQYNQQYANNYNNQQYPNNYNNQQYPNNYNNQQYQNNYNNQQYSLGSSQNYELPSLGSTYGSGLYGGYGSLSYGYAPMGFNVRYPNWQQGNSFEYYTGGTGSGLIVPNYQWYRKFRNGQAQPRSGDSVDQKSDGSNPPASNGNLLTNKLRAKRNIR